MFGSGRTMNWMVPPNLSSSSNVCAPLTVSIDVVPLNVAADTTIADVIDDGHVVILLMHVAATAVRAKPYRVVPSGSNVCATVVLCDIPALFGE
jgi:hypothetical protein